MGGLNFEPMDPPMNRAVAQHYQIDYQRRCVTCARERETLDLPAAESRLLQRYYCSMATASRPAAAWTTLT